MFRPPKVCSNVPPARKLSEGSNYGIQGFNLREVENKTLIGQGAFGKVYRASYKTKDVVLKELHGVEEKDIVREARFLNHLRHENLVEFVGMSLEEQSLMLEYLGFDFAAFGKDVTVSNLEEFLHQMKISQFCGFEHFPGIITNDIVNGIKYLHSKGVAAICRFVNGRCHPLQSMPSLPALGCGNVATDHLFAMAGNAAQQLDDGKKQSVKARTGWNVFYQNVAPSIKDRLAEDADIGKVSSVASKMWRQLGERRKDWRNEAQRIREDLDTGVTELRKNCQKCNKSFVREKDLRYHEKSCGSSTCKECGAVCKDFVQLRSHIAMEHTKEYSCETCKKCFPSKRNLERHKVKHTREKLICDICGIQFATKSNRKRHIKKQH